MTTEDGEESLSSSAAGGDVSRDVIPLHSTNLLTVLDKHGVVQYESPSIESIYGYDQDALLDQQVAEYIHPADRDAVMEAFSAVVSGESGTVQTVEYRHEQADGTYCWVESVASTNPTPEGNYVINTRDISEQKVREQKLRETNERLEEFVRVVSHDLRNPLQVAQGRLELAAEDCTSEQLTVVEQAHRRMQTLIADLLALTRNDEEGRGDESVELRSVVADSWRTGETGETTLETHTESVLSADRLRLQQLLENLIRNAVEHGGNAVTITVGDLDTGFYVEDDGPGIPEADRETVFDIGYSTANDGTGFGLHIVTQVVEAHDWNIRIVDGPDDGTRFEITGVEFEQ